MSSKPRKRNVGGGADSGTPLAPKDEPAEGAANEPAAIAEPQLTGDVVDESGDPSEATMRRVLAMDSESRRKYMEEHVLQNRGMRLRTKLDIGFYVIWAIVFYFVYFHYYKISEDPFVAMYYRHRSRN